MGPETTSPAHPFMVFITSIFTMDLALCLCSVPSGMDEPIKFCHVTYFCHLFVSSLKVGIVFYPSFVTLQNLILCCALYSRSKGCGQNYKYSASEDAAALFIKNDSRSKNKDSHSPVSIWTKINAYFLKMCLAPVDTEGSSENRSNLWSHQTRRKS